MFTEKDRLRAESLILQHPWMSEYDFFDFIGNGGSYFAVNNKKLQQDSKQLFFCKIRLEDSKLYIICRFFGGRCDIEFEVLKYSAQQFKIRKKDSQEIITYEKVKGPGPMVQETGLR